MFQENLWGQYNQHFSCFALSNYKMLVNRECRKCLSHPSHQEHDYNKTGHNKRTSIKGDWHVLMNSMLNCPVVLPIWFGIRKLHSTTPGPYTTIEKCTFCKKSVLRLK